MPAAWIRCDDCGEFFCLIHGMHAAECDCPPVDELDFDPYCEGFTVPNKPVIIQVPPDLEAALMEHVTETHTIQAEILRRLAKSLRVTVAKPVRGRPVGWRKDAHS